MLVGTEGDGKTPCLRHNAVSIIRAHFYIAGMLGKMDLRKGDRHISSTDGGSAARSGNLQ